MFGQFVLEQWTGSNSGQMLFTLTESQLSFPFAVVSAATEWLIREFTTASLLLMMLLPFDSLTLAGSLATFASSAFSSWSRSTDGQLSLVVLVFLAAMFSWFNPKLKSDSYVSQEGELQAALPFNFLWASSELFLAPVCQSWLAGGRTWVAFQPWSMANPLLDCRLESMILFSSSKVAGLLNTWLACQVNCGLCRRNA